MIIIIIQIIARVYVGNKKTYFHMDEAYSYGLMNYDKLNIADNEDFFNNWHTKEYYSDYLEINKDEKYDFSQVYENQRDDVHPPIYYLLLRIAASFTIDSFSKWTGLILNIIIFIFEIIFVYLISKEILKNEKLALFTCFIVGLIPAALETTMYIRMYELASLNILIITYLHIKNYDKEVLNLKELSIMGIAVVIGFLTHYYYIIFLVGLYIIYMFKYIKNKNYKAALRYTICLIISGIISLIIFPYAISHIFLSYRGQEAQGSLLSSDKWFIDIANYLNIIDNKVFSNNIIIIFAIIFIFRKKIKTEKKVWLLIMPTVLYLILVAKISPYKEIRYIMPICICIMIITIYLLNKCIKSQILICAILLICILIPNELEYTYRKYEYIVEKIEDEHNLPAIYIFNLNENRFLDDIYLFTLIDRSYIMNYNDFSEEKLKSVLNEVDISNGIILFTNNMVDNEKVKEEFNKLINNSEIEHLQRMNACDIFILKMEEENV